MIKLLLDASAIISWCEELESLEIKEMLESKGYELVITEKVEEEVLENEVTSLHREVVESVEIVSPDKETYRRLYSIKPRLGEGEVSIICVGKELDQAREDYLCVLDDKLARETCEDEDIHRTGSIGLLNLLIADNLITENEAKQKLRIMDKNGARLPDNFEDLVGEKVKHRIE